MAESDGSVCVDWRVVSRHAMLNFGVNACLCASCYNAHTHTHTHTPHTTEWVSLTSFVLKRHNQRRLGRNAAELRRGRVCWNLRFEKIGKECCRERAPPSAVALDKSGERCVGEWHVEELAELAKSVKLKRVFFVL